MEQSQNAQGKDKLNREYLLSLGTVENYIRREKNKEPPRWRHLAERALIGRPIRKYSELFGQGSKEDSIKKIVELDSLVDELNVMRESGGIDFSRVSSVYDRIVSIVTS